MSAKRQSPVNIADLSVKLPKGMTAAGNSGSACYRWKPLALLHRLFHPRTVPLAKVFGREGRGEGEPFSGRLSNELHRKQDTLFPQLLDSRKITELLSWAVVYESHRPCYLFIGQPGKIPPSGKELPQQAVALFVQRTFPRTARMAEVTFYLKGLIDLPEAEELLAPVIGQGMPIACGDAGKQLLQAGRDALHVSRPAKCSHEKAAFAFHSRQDIA